MNQDLLNQVLCCFSLKGDFNEHFVNDPVLMKCGRNACKKCAKDSYIFKKKSPWDLSSVLNSRK